MVLLRFPFRTFLLFLFSYSNAAVQTATAPLSGDGSRGDPSHIATRYSHFCLTEKYRLWDQSHRQTADIDASSLSSRIFGSGNSPISSTSTIVAGSYDGGEYTNSGLLTSRCGTDDIGMSGVISAFAVKFFHLNGINVSGNGNVGASSDFNGHRIVDDDTAMRKALHCIVADFDTESFRSAAQNVGATA